MDQILWCCIRLIAPPEPSKMRGGGSRSHASDARYSASKCQKRTYNFILSTITRFIMVGFGSFLDQCVLHVQAHQNNTKYEKSPKKFFFYFWPTGGTLGKKNFWNKIFTDTYTSYKHVIRCVCMYRTHWSRNHPNPTIMKQVMVGRLKL